MWTPSHKPRYSETKTNMSTTIFTSLTCLLAFIHTICLFGTNINQASCSPFPICSTILESGNGCDLTITTDLYTSIAAIVNWPISHQVTFFILPLTPWMLYYQSNWEQDQHLYDVPLSCFYINGVKCPHSEICKKIFLKQVFNQRPSSWPVILIFLHFTISEITLLNLTFMLTKCLLKIWR